MGYSVSDIKEIGWWLTLVGTVLAMGFLISSCVQNQQRACIEGILSHAEESQVWEKQVSESLADCTV